METTKRPWTHDGKYVYDGDEKPILRIHAGGEAAIPEVVLAVNNFDEMVEALNEAKEYLNDAGFIAAQFLANKICALLAKVKEG